MGFGHAFALDWVDRGSLKRLKPDLVLCLILFARSTLLQDLLLASLGVSWGNVEIENNKPQKHTLFSVRFWCRFSKTTQGNDMCTRGTDLGVDP